MPDPLTYVATKYALDLHRRSPIEIQNIGRDDLAQLFVELGFHVGVEVGVERGLYSEVLCRAGLELTCVDGWRAYRGYRDHVDQGKLDGFYEEAYARLRPFGARIMRKFSLEAVQDFADGSLDFVYLDGNHDLPNVINDIHAWGRKVRVGGILAGHDYVRYHWPNQIHVVQAVNAYTEAYEIHPWFLAGTKAKVLGETRDTARSWFWVKPAPRTKTYRGIVKQ